MSVSAFRLYDPSQGLHNQPPKACEECHSRKVRCVPSADGSLCQYCRKHGTECIPRSRKRRRTHRNQDHDHEEEEQSRSRRPADRTATHSAAVDRQNGWHRDDQRRSPAAPPPLLFAARRGPVSAESSPATSSTVDRFHNSSYLCRTAILGQDFQDIDHSNGANSTREYTLSPTDMEVLHLYKAFDLPDLPERESLIDVFFDRCWVYMPVIDRPSLEDPNTVSLLVLQALLLVGCIMRPHRYPPSAVQAQFKRVRALINSSYERNPLNLLAALCIIQWNPSAAPRDISMDSPRFFTTMAIGIAQQMGLHRASTTPKPDEALRRRVWWTLCSRDNTSAACHGRPLMINSLDCTQPLLSLDDYPDPRDHPKARCFIHCIPILQILGNLCQSIVRHGEVEAVEKADIASRLLKCLDSLPPELQLIDPTGSSAPYNLDIAQVHIQILTTISILYRPKSIFSLTSTNAASVAAANLSFRIFEAIELREHTHCLSSASAWHMLVACIPLLSCLRIAHLKDSANSALDTMEKAFTTLGEIRPAATSNLRSVMAIRKAMTSSMSSGGADTVIEDTPLESSYLSMAPALLRLYGNEAVHHYEDLVEQLGSDVPARLNDGDATSTRNENDDTLQQQQDFFDCLALGDSDPFNFDDLFGEGQSWMMRDWVAEPF